MIGSFLSKNSCLVLMERIIDISESLLPGQLLREAPSQPRAFPPFELMSTFLNLTRSVTYYQTIDHQLLAGLNLLFDHTARKLTFYVFHLGHEEGGEGRDVGFWLQLIAFFFFR